jgi:hypothetical protein
MQTDPNNPTARERLREKLIVAAFTVLLTRAASRAQIGEDGPGIIARESVTLANAVMEQAFESYEVQDAD